MPHLKHKQIFGKTIALFVSLILVLTAALFLSAPMSRAATFIPFGGSVISLVFNPTPAGQLICPVYALVTNISPTNGLPSVFGVYIPSVPPGTIYAYGNLFTPDVPLLGGVLPIPCPAPDPVYPLFYNAPFYLAGTGAF